MTDQFKKQCEKKPRGFRYNDRILKNFSMNMWIVGGRECYEIWNANFPSVFPCPRTIESWLDDYDMSVREGQLNIEMLKHYLVLNNFPMVVSISEDQTGLSGTREYVNQYNSVVGGSLPLQSNGFPNYQDSYAGTAHDIVQYFNKYERASDVFVSFKVPGINIYNHCIILLN